MTAMYSSRKKLTLGDFILILVGLGIISVIVILVLAPIIKSSKYRQTVATINEARESIVEFALREKRLPTPAEFSTISMNIDAWGGTLIYVPDLSFTTSGMLCCSPPSGIVVKDKGREVPDIAFIVISEGKNRVNDTGKGLLFSIEDNKEYDDITSYERIADLLERAGCTHLGVENEKLPVAVEDVFYSAKLDVRSECKDVRNNSYRWEVSDGELPPGLVLGGDGSLTGTINIFSEKKGLLSACFAEYPFKIKVSGAGGLPTEKEFVLRIVPWRLRILGKDIPSAIAGQDYSFTPEGRGGKNEYVWSLLSGSLPPGLGLDQKTGTVAGRVDTAAAGPYTFTLSLSDGCSEDKKAFTIRIGGCSPMRVIPPPPLTAIVGKSFSHSLVIEGGQPPYTMESCVNNCAGLGISLKCLDTGAVLSGTPESLGSCAFSVEWLDSCASGAQILKQDYILNILEGVPAKAPVEGVAPSPE